jgi:hypothetical protein
MELPPPIAELPESALERVHRKLRTCQHLLAAPSTSAMLACGTCMGEIRFELESLAGGLGSAPPELRVRLRERVAAAVDEFRHAKRLLDSAATLYKGWTHVLASHTRGYTRSGAPAALRYGTETLLRG